MVKLKRLPDYVVPALVLCYIGWTWWLCTFHVAVGWLWRMNGHRLGACIYLAFAGLASATVIPLYIDLLSSSRRHFKISQEPPEQVRSRTIPFECSDDVGSLNVCKHAPCAGRWKPMRTHHCRVCDECRIGFDHHCPWIGTCVDFSNKRDFLLFLWTTPITLLMAFIPLIPQLGRHIRLAYGVSQKDPWILKNWWGWYGSWIVFGGPMGRYLGAVFLGYRAINKQSPSTGSGYSALGSYVSDPSILCLVTSVLSLFFVLFSLGVAIRTTIDVMRGETPVERLGRQRSPPASMLLWIPSLDHISSDNTEEGRVLGGRVVSISLQKRPFNRGWRWNISQVWSRSTNLSNELNPKLIEELR